MRALKAAQVNPHNLKVARENIGCTTRQVTDRICGKKTKLDKVKLWEAGEDYPTFTQLQNLAHEYNINPFLLTSQDNMRANRRIPAYRRSSNNAEPNINCGKFINFLLQRQRFLSYIMKSNGHPKNKIAGRLDIQREQPPAAAKQIAAVLEYEPIKSGKIPGEHLRHLLWCLEAKKVFVMKTLSYWPIPRDYMQGMYLHDSYAPIIALNRGDAKTAQLFTLAHEIAHLFTKREYEGTPELDFRNQSNTREERFCNQVAANLLLPEELVAAEEYNYADLEELAETYQLSGLFVFYRLRELGRLSKSNEAQIRRQLDRKFQAAATGKADKDKGGSYINNMKDSNGAFYNEFIESLYLDGKISPVETVNLVKIGLEELLK